MKNIITLFLTLLISVSAHAAAGDDCSTAITLSSNACSASGAYNNTGIAGNLVPSCFGGGNNNGMWFKFVATGPVVNITVNGGTLASPMVCLLSSSGSCVSPYTELSCSNPGGTSASVPYNTLTIGSTYYVYVDGANNNTGTFQVCVSSPSQPTNDLICNAISVGVSNFCSTAGAYTNIGATPDMASSTTIYPPSCWSDGLGVNNGVWFKFVPTAIGVDISVTGGLTAPLIAVFQPPANDCNSTDFANYFQRVCAQSTTGTTTSLTSQYFVPGQTYYILVDGYSNNTGTFKLCVNSYTPPVLVTNDDCTNAIALCPGSSYHGTTFGATNTNDFSALKWNCNGDANNVIWYSFVTTNPVQPIVFNVAGTSEYVQFEAFKYIGGNVNPCVDSNTDNKWSSLGPPCIQSATAPNTFTIPASSMVANTKYYLLIDNLPNTPLTLDFSITGNQGALAGANQTVCVNAAPFTMTGFSPATGGTWSGTGITNSATGAFDPAIAGIGLHTLALTFGPCTSYKTVKVTGPTVAVSNNISICPAACITLTASATQPSITATSVPFTASPNLAISSTGTSVVTSSINVSGLSNATLQSICLNINHTYDGDLSLYLVCPSGTTLTLSARNGGLGNDYNGTCFNLTSGTSIVSGAAPFSAAAGYIPQGGGLSTFNNCATNGVWTLIVKDVVSGDGGSLNNWTLNFNNKVTTTVPATSFTWSPTTAMSGSGSLTPTVCPTSSTVYSITATDANGCKANDAISVIVTPVIVTASSNTTICSGSSTGLTASGATTYSWIPSTGLSSTTGSTVTASPTITTTYTVVGTSTLGNCTNTAVVTVSVTASPALSVVSPSFCVGSSGSLSASGASTYTWSPGTGLSSTSGASVTANPTVTTNYTVTGTTAAGCIATQTAIVTVNPKPAATLTFTNPTCGLSNGIVVIIPTNTVTISTFASSLGALSGQTVTALAAGSPIITLTSNLGCTFTVSTTLTMTPFPTAIATTTVSSTCGNANGTLSFTTSTGVSPYTYTVNGVTPATSPTISLLAGAYPVIVRDLNGCTFSVTATISNIPGPTALAGTSSPASCAGPTGSYTVTGVTGGTATYSYSIDGSAFATTSVITSLASGTHSITVKDANGCTFPTTFNVGLLAGITSATVNASTANCGTANGTSTVTGVTGGVPTYSYSFDGGGFTGSSSTTGLAAGNHTVIIKDVNTCTLSVPYTVLNSGSPTATVTGFTDPLCAGGSTGSFSVSASGGSGTPFTYTVTSPFSANGIGVFSGLPAGTYNINIKDVANCITTASVVLTNPTPIAITATATAAKCFGAATGTINVTGSGGTPTYSYNLNGGATYQASSTFANQFAAIYTMGVKDANGCLATQTVQVTQPTALAIQVASQNANCTAANGIGTTTVTGGTGAITYTWTGGGGAAAISNGIVTGNYTVTATDGNGCVITSPVVIGLTPGGTAAITGSTNITCNGANNGSMTAGMTGGASPFTYLWAAGGQTVATAVNLSPGTYTCTITDFYGCKATATGTITQPPVLTAIMNSNNVKCFGGSTGTVSAAGSGGAGSYTYLWSTIPSTLSTVNNVAIGNYPVTITDLNGCTVTASIPVNQPTAISLTYSVTTANCNQANGSATVTAIGGALGAYTYSWSAGSLTAIQASVTANTYTILVQDANNCQKTLAVTIPNASGPIISITSQTNVSCFGGSNGAVTTTVSGGVGTYTYSWSNGPTTPIATNLTANIYVVSATDAAGCVASTSVNITQPTQLTVGILKTNPKCFGATNGSAIAAAGGGTPSYTYAWTGGGGGSATTNQLGAGNYGLTVTDGNGCVITSSMALINPPAMTTSITSTSVTCFGTCNGTAIATSTNGVGVVSYFWTGGPSPIAAQTASGLCAGSYTVLATDQNNCTASAQVPINQPTQVTVSITSTGSVTCNGGNNGFAVVTPGGGTGTYSYTWSPSGGNTATASTLTAGVYVVTVKDINLCTATATATILQPTPLVPALTKTDVKCNGACDGTANIAFSGGSGTTTFLWQPGLQSGNFVNNLCVGSQTVTITSNAACPTILTFTLTQPAPLTAVASATNSNCGQNNGKTCVVVGGGTLPYGNLWSNGITTLCNNNIVAGAYSFTVTDGNSCKAFASGLVNDIAGPVVTVLSQTNISCFNGNNGAATTTITGGVQPYSISWSSGQTTLNVNNFNVGIKLITGVDAAGCVGTNSVSITQPTQLTKAIGSFTNVTCNGLSNGGATLLVNGGITPYNYLWTPSAQTSSVLSNVPANAYTVNITDGNGCTTSTLITISQPQPLTITSSSSVNVSCFGGNNGQISIGFSGGTVPYSYSWTPSGFGSGGTLTGLTAGGYSLSLLDKNNCPQNANFTITEPSVLTSSYTSLPATCGLINGSATVTVGGGSPTYNVVWNTPGTPTGTTVSNMAPGSNWIANITDSKGCSATQTVNIANPPVPVFTGYTSTQPSCFGLSDGNITVNYTAGTAPYTIVWSNPISQTIVTSALTQSVSPVAAGNYTATVTDNYGCSTAIPVIVAQPPLLTLVISQNTTICYGTSTQITALASGGNITAPYTYSWVPSTFVGAGPHTVSPTITSTYVVSVSDIKGCSASPKVITISVTPQLIAIGKSFTLCHGGMAVLTPTITSPGNSGAYTYTWNPAAGNSNSTTVIGNAPAGATTNTYAVTVSDGCTIPDASAIFTVNVNPLPVISFTANPLQGCAPLTLTLTGTSDGPNDLFTWTNNKTPVVGLGSFFPTVFPDSGKYTITLNVVNPVTTCSNTITKPNYIEVFPQPIASFYADPTKASILDPNFNFINTSQGATSYYWDFGDPAAISGSNSSIAINPSHGYTYVGQYAVNLVATSLKGCKDTAQLIVEITPDFALYIPNTFTPDGNGLNDVFQPMGVGIDEDNYRMDIFDRWGENIFTSNNFRKGWDGTVKGGSKIAEQGVYTYKVLVRDIMGNKHPMVGHVTVLRQN